MGRTSATAATAVPWKSAPLTRGVKYCEPTLGMIHIYGTNDVGVKSQADDNQERERKITEPGWSGAAVCTVE